MFDSKWWAFWDFYEWAELKPYFFFFFFLRSTHLQIFAFTSSSTKRSSPWNYSQLLSI